jgi:hypothetical protein
VQRRRAAAAGPSTTTRSVPDARDIVDELTDRGVRLDLGGSVRGLADPTGRLLFTVLSMIAEFEADLARARRASRSSLVTTRVSPGPAGGQGLAQAGPRPVGAADAVVDVDAVGLHTEGGEGLALGGEVLPVGGDPGVADLDGGHGSSVPG